MDSAFRAFNGAGARILEQKLDLPDVVDPCDWHYSTTIAIQKTV